MRVQDREPKMEMQRARHGPENLGHMMQVRASSVSDSCNSYTRFENVPRLSDHLDHNNDDLSSPQKIESVPTDVELTICRGYLRIMKSSNQLSPLALWDFRYFFAGGMWNALTWSLRKTQ